MDCTRCIRPPSHRMQVMTFELWHPFATAMERAVLLRDL